MSNLFENPSSFQDLTPGECCVSDKFVTNAVIAYNASNSKYELTITFNDGSTIVEPYPSAFTDDVKVSAFGRHPDATTNPTYQNTIRITLSDATIFDLDLSYLVNIDSALINTNVLTVTKSGNDTDALAAGKYDFHEPWLNPTVAMTNAAQDDVVVVYPGTYIIGSGGLTDDGNQHMVKHRVMLYMMPGAKIQYTNATGTISLPFSDGGSTGFFKIKGKGAFEFSASTTTAVDYYNVTTHAGSTVDWEFDSIATRRRFGAPIAQAPAFSKWRMVGREYTNINSGIFQFELPASSTNKLIDIDIENVTLSFSNSEKPAWTANKIKNFGYGSIANIKYGTVTFPNAVDGGGFHENDTCANTSIINLTINNIKRIGHEEDPYKDYLIYHNADASKGTYIIKNINSQRGLIKSNAATGVEACRTAYLHGNLFTNTNSNSYIIELTDTAVQYKIEMDIIHNGQGEYDWGIYARESYKVKLSGYLNWANGNLQEPIHLQYNGSSKALTLWNFIISQTGGTHSIKNLNATNVDLFVMNTFATKSISAANGGVTQSIGTITVDSNV